MVFVYVPPIPSSMFVPTVFSLGLGCLLGELLIRIHEGHKTNYIRYNDDLTRHYGSSSRRSYSHKRRSPKRSSSPKRRY